jgi:MFS family permease
VTARARRLKEYGLAAGELGAAAGQTTIVVVLPLLLAQYASSAFWVGFAVGGEGIFALMVPYWIGLVSDRLPEPLVRRFGRRTFILIAAAPLMAASIALAPFLHGYWPIAAAGFVFFAALQSYLTPLWALMIDSVPNERRGSVQGVRGVFRALGLAYGLVAGGLLYSIWEPLPFVVAAALILVTTAITFAADRTGSDGDDDVPAGTLSGTWRELRGNRPALWTLSANALWNGGIDGIRPYFMLFATIVIGITVAQASLVLVVLIVGVAIGSLVIGRLGDRFDRGRLLQLSGALLTIGMGAGLLVRNVFTASIILLAAGIGAAGLITLPYPYFAELVGDDNTGQYTGIFVLSVGLGRIFAPMLIGGAIDLGRAFMPAERGYPFMWIVAALFSAAGWFAIRRASKLASVKPPER